MDAQTLTTVITTATGVIGGLYGGSRYGKQSALADAANNSAVAVDTVEMLQTQINHLNDVNAEQAVTVVELSTRVNVLEGLVTQRAAVEEVHHDVLLIKAKVGA
jgi:hypothetical protein